MGAAAFFRNTPLVSCLRAISRGRILPYPQVVGPFPPTCASDLGSTGKPPSEEAESSGDTQQLPQSQHDPYLVTWDGEGDPENPINFPFWAKLLFLFQIGLLAFLCTVSSSVFAGGLAGIMETFECGHAVAALGLTTFVAGYGIGPIFWGPLSEIPFVGRNLVYIPTLAVFVCLQVPTALAGNLGTFLSMRFLGGLMSSPIMAVGGGSLVDVFEPQQLPYVLSIYSGIAAFGPMLGPLIGGFAYQNHGWRWTIWAILWMGGFILLVTIFCLPESSADKLLRDKAARLRQQTGDPRWRSESDSKGLLSFQEIGRVYLIRPFALLTLEPIVLLLSLYLAVLYGLEYLFFEAFPFVFSQIYGWSPGITGLGFFGLLIGVFAGCAFQVFFIRYRYTAIWARTGQPPPLEEWLWPTLFGSISVPISMFWFGWSANSHTHWIVPIIGSIPFGFALLVFFQAIITYLSMGYSKHAASVLAANDFLRSSFAAAFPVFTHALYNNLGVGWASSLIAFISLGLAPISFIFYRYGANVRSWSKYAD